MKTSTLIYILSLLIVTVAFVLLINFPNSGRYSLIAGALFSMGFMLNIASYALKTKSTKV